MKGKNATLSYTWWTVLGQVGMNARRKLLMEVKKSELGAGCVGLRILLSIQLSLETQWRLLSNTVTEPGRGGQKDWRMWHLVVAWGMVKGDVTATETRNGGGFVDTSQALTPCYSHPNPSQGSEEVGTQARCWLNSVLWAYGPNHHLYWRFYGKTLFLPKEQPKIKTVGALVIKVGILYKLFLSLKITSLRTLIFFPLYSRTALRF